MNKITVLESAGFLGIRIKQLFEHYGFDQTVVIETLINNNVRYTFKDSKVIILDLDNRHLNIVSLIEAIKKEEVTRHIPLILLSSHSDIKTLKQAIGLGCSDFVTKPFSDDLLMEKVHKLIHKAYTNIGTPSDVDANQTSQEQKFSWQADYEIGVEEIDREHKAIINNYEKLYHHMMTGKGHDYYNEMMDFLKQYVDEHFAHEEAFQESIHYDQMEEHKSYHRSFDQQIQAIIANYEVNEVTNMDLVKMNLFLKDWLLHHILIEDAKIGRFIERKKT